MGQAPIRLAVVKQPQVPHLGLRASLESDDDIEVVGEFESVDRMMAATEGRDPDVVLIGTAWPSEHTLLACRELRTEMPATKALLISATDREEEVLDAIEADASGLLTDGAPIFYLLFASKHSRGLDFWEKSSTRLRSGQRILI